MYLLGQLLSVFGDSTLWLAVAIWVKELTGSSSKAGLAFFAFTAGTLTAPVAGWLADRVLRRRLLLWTNLATGVVVLLLLPVNEASVWVIYAVMFAYGVSNALISAAQGALLPHLVPEEHLSAANSVLATGRESIRLVAPLLAAGAVAWTGTAKPIAVLDAVTFAVVAVTLLVISPDESRDAGPSSESWWAEMTAGLNHLARTVVLREMVIALAAALFVIGFSQTLVFAVVDHGLHRSATFVGLLSAVQGGGSLAGGSFAPWLMRRWGEGRCVAGALILIGLGQLLWLPASLPPVLVGAAMVGAALPVAVVGYVTLIQRQTPDRLRGRTLAAADVAISVPQTISIALGAALLLALDYRLLLGVEAVVEAAAGLWLITRRSQRVRGDAAGVTPAWLPVDTPIASLTDPPSSRSAATTYITEDD